MKLYRTCAEVREDFSALLDNELTPDEREALEAHLSVCSECLRELDGLKRVDTVYRSLPPTPAPHDFERRVKASLRPKLVRLPNVRMKKFYLGPALAAAAVFLVVVATSSNFLRITTNGSMERQEMAAVMDDPLASTSESEADSTIDRLGRAQSAPASPDVAAESGAVAESPADGVHLGVEFSPEAETEAVAAPTIAAAAPPQSPASAEAAKEMAEERSLQPEGAPARQANARAEAADIAVSADEFRDAAGVAAAPPATQPTSVQLPAEPMPEVAQALEPQEQPADQSAAGAASRRRMDTDAGSRLLGTGSGPAEPKDKKLLAAPPAGAMLASPAAKAEATAFEKVDGVFRQKGYAGEPVIELKPESEALRGIVEAKPDVRSWMTWDGPVIFSHEGKWYKLMKNVSR